MLASSADRKKILFLTPRVPYPPYKGDQAVAYHRLRTLGPHHDITLLTFVEGREDPGAEAALRPFCQRILRVPLPKWRIGWNLLSRGAWSTLPLQVIYFHSPAFQAHLRVLLAEGFDLVHAFMLRLFPYLEGIQPPVLLECIDSMRLNMSRQAAAARGWRRWVYQEELRRLGHYESGIDAHIERAIFVSPIDAEYSGSAKALALPLGVEVPTRQAACEGSVVVFSGNMAYAPNALAVTWFVQNCWADLRARHPQATFRVLGGGATEDVLALGREPGVEIRGYVPDMAEALLEADLAVAPMQSGSGMQFKILEAMACGLPVVTTNLGRGAIGAGPDQGLWVADDPDAVTEATSRLLGDPDLRCGLGGRGRAFVQAEHSWEHAGKVVEHLWSQVLASRNTLV